MDTDDGRQARAQTAEVLGVRVDLLPTTELTEVVAGAVRDRRRLLVGNHNLHSLYLVKERPELRRFFDAADLVFVDGMSLVALARLTGRRIPRECRSTPLDWIGPLLERLDDGTRVFLLGSREGEVERTAAVFREKYPRCTFLSRHGYFDATPGAPGNEEVLAALDAARPDLLLVGMGMPRQEDWVADNLARLDVPVILTVGGLFDYFNGQAGTPPRWMGRVGLEWLYRLADDPRRLAHRYLVEPLLLLRLLVRERRR